ncbi:hypothetical protein BDZ91DRAFT_754782 [Kalaharituber pfeilii]|nr:hypothetical protein BDZ91DRAFT_754782 [Kalaharituber pfeilii]
MCRSMEHAISCQILPDCYFPIFYSVYLATIAIVLSPHPSPAAELARLRIILVLSSIHSPIP